MASSGAEIASAYVALTVKMPGVGRDVSRALGGNEVQSALSTGGKSMGAVLAGAVGGAVAAATTKAISMVTGAIGDAVKRVDIMNNFPKIMKNLGYSAKDATKSINKMSDGLKGLPTSLDSMAGMVQQLAPLAGGLGEATDLSLALNNALLAGGKSTDYQANAMEQYTQMLAIGKVDMAAWRSLVSAMPGQMDQLSVSLLGAGNKSMDLYEAMKSGEVTFDDFNQAVLKLNTDGIGSFASFEKQARDSTDGIGTGWANLQTAITRNLATIIQKLKPAIDAFLVGGTAIANALGPALVGLIDAATAVGGWASANRDWLGPAAVFVGTLLAVYKGTQAIRAVTLGYQAAMKGAQIATFLTGGALKAYNITAAVTATRTKIATAATGRWTAFTKAHAAATTASGKAQAVFNAVLGANPILKIVTLIAALVAGLIWFFTQTELGQAIFAEFSRFLGEAWANISGFFTAAYENVIKPVFDGIATVVKWVWETIIQPIFAAIGFAAAILGGVIVGLYEVFVKPAIDAIGVAFTWVYENVIKPAIDGIKLYIQGWAIVLSWLWTAVVKPVLDAIGQAFQWAWSTFIKPAVTAMGVGLKGLGDWFTWLWRNVVKPVWDGISGIIKSAWEKGIKPVIDTLVRVVQSDPKKAFEAARDAIGVAWKGIQDLAKKPVKFVVETVFGGLIDAVNGFLPKGLKLPRPSLPKGFSEGGYTGNIAANAVAGVVHGDEHVIRAASRRAIESKHPGLLDHMNRTGSIPGYRKGGLVHPLPGSVITTQWMGYPGHTGMDFAKPQGTPIQAAAAGVVSQQFYHGMYGNMVDLSHGDGFSTRYAHMLANVAVRLGQVVKAGQVIGYEGSTGNSTGPHLHFETLQNGSPMNPAPFLSGAQTIAPATGIVDGLLDGALSKFKAAFPGGGFFVDAAAGLMRSGVKGITDWIGEKLSFGVGGAGIVPTLFDNGGWLQPGRHLVENKTGRPEPILTASQWDAMRAGRDRSGPVVVRIGSRDFEGWMDDRADEAVDRGLSDQEADRRRAMYR